MIYIEGNHRPDMIDLGKQTGKELQNTSTRKTLNGRIIDHSVFFVFLRFLDAKTSKTG